MALGVKRLDQTRLPNTNVNGSNLKVEKHLGALTGIIGVEKEEEENGVWKKTGSVASCEKSSTSRVPS
jgi:hypothetical protein